MTTFRIRKASDPAHHTGCRQPHPLARALTLNSGQQIWVIDVDKAEDLLAIEAIQSGNYWRGLIINAAEVADPIANINDRYGYYPEIVLYDCEIE